MSVINKKPFIIQVLETLSVQQVETLAQAIDGQGSEPIFRSLLAGSPNILKIQDAGIKPAEIEVARPGTAQRVYQGYLIYTGNEANQYCVLIHYSDDMNQGLSIVNMKFVNGNWSHQVLPCELSITELRSELNDLAKAEEKQAVDAVYDALEDGSLPIKPEYISDKDELITGEDLTSGAIVSVAGFNADGEMVKGPIPAGSVVDADFDIESENPVQNKVITEKVNEIDADLGNKANVDGNYPTMTVGNADQLNSTVYVVDKVPYLYRTSGGDADIGNREYDKIIGGSLAVNQLIQNGNFANTTGWSTYQCTLTASDNIGSFTGTAVYSAVFQDKDIPVGHKVLATVDVKLTTGTTDVALFVQTIGSNGAYYKMTENTTNWQTLSKIVEVIPNTTKVRFHPIQDRRASDWDAIQMKNAMLIDLTVTLGSTIADYIYSLEQANAGAGVAWFRKYFNKPYYPYNTGAIKNVKLVSHDTVGFNQWDEEWELGGFNNTTGEKTSSSINTTIRSKNKIKVFPNTTYYVNKGSTESLVVLEYDADDNFLKPVNAFSSSKTFTTKANTAYIYFYCLGTTYKNDICINLSWSGWRNGQYEAYQKNSYPLDTTIELRGIPKLDSNNNLYFDGDEYSSDGKVVRKYGVVDLGTLNWELRSTGTNNKGWSAQLPNNYNVSGQGTNWIAEKVYQGFTDGQTIVRDGADSYAIGIYNYGTYGTTNYVYAITSVNETPTGYLIYELATPTEETAAPFQEPQIVDDFGTEEYVVPTQDGWQVPVGHDTKYPANLRDKLQRLPDMPSVSQNVTETYVVNYNGATKKCTFVDIDTWLGSNGYAKADTLPTKEALGGTLRQLLATKESLDFNNTDFVDLGELTWTYVAPDATYPYGYFSAANLPNYGGSNKLLSTKYKTVNGLSVAKNTNNSITGHGSINKIFVVTSSYTDATSLKNALKGQLFAYEKASS